MSGIKCCHHLYMPCDFISVKTKDDCYDSLKLYDNTDAVSLLAIPENQETTLESFQ